MRARARLKCWLPAKDKRRTRTPGQHDMGVSAARMIDSAHCDQLTGLLNRRLVRDRCCAR